jgi:hypothetical protein
MKIFFFNYQGHINEVANDIFKSLGINKSLQGESLNVQGGIYNSFSVFGLNIKIEQNSYNYEDEFTYMMSVGKDLVSSVMIDSDIENFIAEAAKRLLSINLSLVIAEEINNKLEIYPPSSEKI